MHSPRIALALLSALCCGCPAGVDVQTSSDWQEESLTAIAAGDYATAIDLTYENLDSGDPEVQFTVGRLMLEWLSDPAPATPPTVTHEQALELIRHAVKSGVPQAAGTLREGYEWGRFSLPRHELLEDCWRNVEIGSADYDSCAEMERERE